MNNTVNDRLDAFLTTLNIAYNEHALNRAYNYPLNKIRIMHDVYFREKKSNYYFDFDLIKAELVGEEMITETYTGYEYVYGITFKGRRFIENGGYVGQLNQQNAQNTRLVAVERATLALTTILAVSAVPTALYAFLQILELKNIVFSIEFLTAGVIFLFGIIAGIIIYMLISEGLSRKNKK